MSITISHITKYYSSQPALDDVSFEVKKGEIAGFIGPNGAGKSTLMKIINGYIPPDSGEVLINDLNVVEYPLEIKKIIGYLPENNPLYPEMYIREYLEYTAGHYMKKNAARSCISGIIAETGLKPECNKKIGALSKGYRQRVGLAQALLHDPQVLILDEPTSGLDPNQIIEIRNLISKIGKEKTIILSSHIMQEVEAICNRVVIINKGKIVANSETASISEQTKDLTETIQVEFSHIPPVKDLAKIEGIIQVKKAEGNVYLVEASRGKDIRADIFNFAVKNNIAVLSMQKKEKRLEEVFRDIVVKGSRDHGITGSSGEIS